MHLDHKELLVHRVLLVQVVFKECKVLLDLLALADQAVLKELLVLLVLLVHQAQQEQLVLREL